jgi:hypothetical protein
MRHPDRANAALLSRRRTTALMHRRTRNAQTAHVADDRIRLAAAVWRAIELATKRNFATLRR